MKNPLIKRLPREIWAEKAKYLIVFIFMTMMVSMISGFLVADASLKKAYDDGFEKYNTEDGNFILTKQADDKLVKEIETKEVKVYSKFYKDENCINDSTLRVFENRDDVNKASILEGNLATADDELAIDRLYAKNNNIEIGDKIKVGDKEFKVTGIVALPDYSALYSNNTDFMFDSIKFGVAVVNKNAFQSLGNKHLRYCYSWVYNDSPKEHFEKEAVDKSEDFLKDLSECTIKNGNQLEDYIPTCNSSAIRFAGEDLGGDRVMFITMMYILIIIIAFVFAITTSNTITKEANVIGTLRATGYTKHELIRHYMAPPIMVLIIAGIVGNVLGYTLFKEIFADMYLGSYSLPKYTTLWNADAFIDTTIVPIIIMILINFIMLYRVLSLSPLKFMRRDLKRRQRKKAFKLNTKIPIMTRFKLRVIFQNIPNYIMIFVGIFVAGVIIFFSTVFNPLLDSFEQKTVDNMIAQHQYILKTPAETKTVGAEKYSAGTLKSSEDNIINENISIYGVDEDSRYIKEDFGDGKIAVSSAYADKYSLKIGEEISLKEEFGDKKYEFTIDEIYDYPCSLAIFMSRDKFNSTFDLNKDSYNGYFSDKEITDIDEKLIASDITKDDLVKTSRQLKKSMGNMMKVFLFVGVAVFVLVIFLLAKIVVEKNAQSIAMTKILGYKNNEINSLYIHTTSIVAILSLIISLPLVDKAMDFVWRMMMTDYTGWLPYKGPMSVFVQTFVIGLVTYIIVALLLSRKAKKVPLDEALKNVE